MSRPIIEKLTGKRLITVLLAVFIAALAAPSFSRQKPLPLEPVKVTVCGVVRDERVEVDEEIKPHNHLMLRLNKPELVAADEFMEERSVDVMQIVFHDGPGLEDTFDNVVKRVESGYLGKRACITGELYHMHTRYHHTDVLIHLRSIELEAKK